VQIGQSLMSESGASANQFRFGHSVDVNADGSTVVCTSPTGGPDSDMNNFSGLAEVFALDNGFWVPKGTPIAGTDIPAYSQGCRLGVSGALSKNGDRLALAEPNFPVVVGPNPFDYDRRGRVRIFDWDGMQWSESATLQGEMTNGLFGHCISLSDDGQTLAVVDWSAGNAVVSVFAENNGQWMQQGADVGSFPSVVIDNLDDLRSEVKVSLSGNGQTLVIGHYKSSQAGTAAGVVLVYEYSGGSWVPKGSALPGIAAGDEFGFSISSDFSGDVVAAGSRGNVTQQDFQGYARVFDFVEGDWEQRGTNIISPTVDIDNFRVEAIDVNQSGSRVVVGLPREGLPAAVIPGGLAIAYQWAQNAWTQIGNPMAGEGRTYDWFGGSLAFSASGDTIVSGAKDWKVSDGVNNNSYVGRAYVFHLHGAQFTNNQEDNYSQIAVYPNPTSDRANVTGLVPGDRISLLSADGHEIRSEIIRTNMATIETDELPAGLYLLMIQSVGKRKAIKFVVK